MDADEKVALVSQMAARIYCERRVFQHDEPAIRMAVGDAFLIVARVEEKLTPKEVGQ